MSAAPHISTKGFKVWLAGHPAYRAQAKALFEILAKDIAEKSGQSEQWTQLRDALSRQR